MTLEHVIKQIAQCAARYEVDYDMKPFDVCLGPKEFNLLWKQGTTDLRQQSILRPCFYQGMRVRLMNSGGVLVGTLTGKV